MGGPDPAPRAWPCGITAALTLGQLVLLHADQLEEILDPASCPQDQTAEFLEFCYQPRPVASAGLHLVGTLRADFWTQLLEHPDAGMRLGGPVVRAVPDEPGTGWSW